MRLRRAAFFAMVRVLSEDDDFHVVGRRGVQRVKHVVREDCLAGTRGIIDELA